MNYHCRRQFEGAARRYPVEHNAWRPWRSRNAVMTGSPSVQSPRIISIPVAAKACAVASRLMASCSFTFPVRHACRAAAFCVYIQAEAVAQFQRGLESVSYLGSRARFNNQLIAAALDALRGGVVDRTPGRRKQMRVLDRYAGRKGHAQA